MSRTRKQASQAAAIWKRQLSPFAKVTADVDGELRAMIEGLSNKRLQNLEIAVTKPTEGNCWWATYRAAEIIKPLVAQEIRLRRSRKWMD